MITFNLARAPSLLTEAAWTAATASDSSLCASRSLARARSSSGRLVVLGIVIPSVGRTKPAAVSVRSGYPLPGTSDDHRSPITDRVLGTWLPALSPTRLTSPPDSARVPHR